MKQKEREQILSQVFSNKKYTCDICPLKGKCSVAGAIGTVCPYMASVYMDVMNRYKKNPETFSEIGLLQHIAKLESELAVIPRTAERYMDVEKALMLAYEVLHKMKYGTKKTVKTTIAKVDINTLVDQADQAEQEIKDEDGETIAIVKKKKREVVI